MSDPVKGTIIRLFPAKGFGFIKPETSRLDVFFHRGACAGGLLFEDLTEGQAVSFTEGAGDRGRRATSVTVLKR